MAMTVDHVGFPADWWDRFDAPEGWRAEIIQGELVLTPSPGMAHGVAGHELHEAFRRHLPAGLVIVQGIEWRLAGADHVVTKAPIPDVMVCQPARALDELPLVAVEILSASDFRRLSDHPALTRIEGKRRDYAAGGLEHYIEVDAVSSPTRPTISRFELVDGELRAVATVSAGPLRAHEPFPYELDPARFVVPVIDDQA